MKYVGIWPEERKWNKPSSYIVLLPSLAMLCFVCGPQTINLPFIAHDLNLIVENLSMANMTITISLMKTVAFWMNGKCKNLIVISYPILTEITKYFLYIFHTFLYIFIFSQTKNVISRSAKPLKFQTNVVIFFVERCNLTK